MTQPNVYTEVSDWSDGVVVIDVSPVLVANPIKKDDTLEPIENLYDRDT